MVRIGVGARAHVIGVRLHSLSGLVGKSGEAPEEAWAEGVIEAESVVEHQHLTVGLRARADTDGRHYEFAADGAGERCGQQLENHGENAGLLKAPGIGVEPEGGIFLAALDPIAAEGVHGLGRQADVAHDGDAGAHEGVDMSDGFLIAAFELDGLRAGLLHDAARVAQGFLGTDLEREERHVHDDEAAMHAAAHGSGVPDHVIECDGQCAVVAGDDLTERITDQDDIDAALVQDPGEEEIVSGERDDFLAAFLLLQKFANRHPPFAGPWLDTHPPVRFPAVTDRDDGFARRHGSAQPGATESSTPIRLTMVGSYLHHPDVSKAIRYDSLLIRALAGELHDRHAGRGVRTIRITPATRTLAIVGRRASLIWNIDPEDGFLLERQEREPGGVTLPRGTRTVAVRARPDDRTIEWLLEAPSDETDGGRRFDLWIELLPSRRAAVLTAEGRVLASMGPVAGPGARYDPPPASPRDGSDGPLTLATFADRLRMADPAGRPRELMRSLAWTSPLNAVAILGEAAASAEAAVLVAAWERYRTIVTHAGSGSAVILEPGGAEQPYPVALPGIPCEPYADLLTAFAARARADDASPGRAVLNAEIGHRVARLEKRMQRLRAELEGAGRDAGLLRRRAELLLSQPGLVRRGMREVILDDWAGGQLAVELDPALDAVGNARAMFDAARRRERAADRLPGLIEKSHAELARVEALRARLAAGEATDAELEGYQPASTQAGGGSRRASLPYRRYRTAAGSEIRVGRGARANDELTFHHSGPEDIWLHARDVGGAHVVLRWNRRDENPPAAELTAAAVLAAVHSRGRTSGVVAVDWTRRKYVRKPRGAAPGRVTIERAKTVFVEPDAALESRLRVE